ncbi:MAG TPA: MDR family MFS transporter [Pseudonocardiaceae bacterium]
MTTSSRPSTKAQAWPRQLLLLLAGLLGAMFLSTLDQTVVSTAMRTIADDLGGLAQQAWVSTAFLIASTVVTPVAGRLSDLYGRRPVFTVCVLVFCAASILCGASTTMLVLICWRAVQGLGAGGLVVLPLTVIADVLPPRVRARYQGVFLAVISLATVIGPLLGGLFAGAPQILGISGWRWAFLINLPVGLLSLWLVAANLRYPQQLQSARIDWAGTAALIVGIVPLLLVAKQGATYGWAAPASWVCYLTALGGWAVFGWAEHRSGDAALLPLSLFQDRAFLLASLAGVVLGFTMLGGLSIIPLYLQIGRGASPMQAGLLLLPTVAGMMLATIGAGRIIARTGRFGLLPVLGAILLTSSLAALSRLTLATPLWALLTGTVFFGVGIGVLIQSLTLISQNTAPLTQMGVATSTATFVRSIGSAFGAAVLIAIVFNGLPQALTATFADPGLHQQLAAALADTTVTADPANRQILAVLHQSGQHSGASLAGALSSNAAFLTHADPRLAAPFLTAFTKTTATALLTAAAIAAVGLVVSLALRPGTLRDPTAATKTTEDDGSSSPRRRE